MAAQAYLYSDVESRKYLQTRTERGGRWDQVLGMSQRIINQSLADMFKNNPEMGRMYNSVEDVGFIKAELEPPEIIIPGADSHYSTDKILYMIRFKSGKMQSSSGATQIKDLAKWTLAIPVPLVWETVANAEDHAADPEKQEVDKLVRARFDKAGEYGIDKLYMALSSMDFSTLDVKYTVCGSDAKNQPISVPTYCKAHPGFLQQLNIWFQQWSRDQEAQGRNVLGIAFKLREEYNADPTFVPSLRRHQAYPYKSKPQGCESGITGPGTAGAAGCNALLYNEMVCRNNPPGDTALSWSGNFATLPQNANDTSTIDGSYVLNRKVLLGAMLDDIRNLIYSANLMHSGGAFRDDQGRVGFSYQMGGDPDFPREHDVWQFTDLNPNDDPEMESGYRWTRNKRQKPVYWGVEITGDGRILMGAGSDNSMKGWINDTLQYDLKWLEGTNKLRLSADCKYEEDIRFSKLNPPNFEDDGIWILQHYDTQVKWHIDIEFLASSINNGQDCLHVTTDMGPDKSCNLEVACQRRAMNWSVASEQDKVNGYKDMLKGPLGWNVPIMVDRVADKLSPAGRFIYPGTGCLGFHNPMFNHWGHLVAGVSYKPLSGLTVMPKQANPKDWPSTGGQQYEKVNNAPDPKFRLSWEVTQKVGPAMKRNRIVLRGFNESKDAWCLFKEIRIQFTAAKDTGTLFFETAWSVSKMPAIAEMPVEVEPKPAKPSSSTNSTSTTKPEIPMADKSIPMFKPAVTKTTTASELVAPPAGDQKDSSVATVHSNTVKPADVPPTTDTAKVTVQPTSAIEPAGATKPIEPAKTSNGSGAANTAGHTVDTTKPVDQPKPPIAGKPVSSGLVYLNQSTENDGDNVAKALVILSDPDSNLWQVTLRGAGSVSQLAVGPGRYVEVVLEAKLGDASSGNTINIEEDWADDKADPSYKAGQFDKNFVVETTAAESVMGKLFHLVTGR